eukprot:CAMPEP_0202691680 /NCGR_PEP_ID=MMETSP1385-20130828/6330_1 /ASSEMBLY_ACC=CAM_ASM_000861 /TAXON_ID=933848 /ORGANISM="Elphidium margaritaceum" /LENGTH=466 /DNA_ID=CAMNT_0049347123 /DNA_START=23 /DNA_END=1423 /DNA_ORIENTATION=-
MTTKDQSNLNGLANHNNNDNNEEAKKIEETESLDKMSELRMSSNNTFDIKASPRRRSIQQALNKLAALQQGEEFITAALMGPTTASTTMRINRRIEQSYLQDIESTVDREKSFSLGDILENVSSGMEVIVDDDFSLCFKRPRRRAWNWNAYLLLLWSIGVVIRYCILLPVRIIGMALAVLCTLLQFWCWGKLFAHDARKKLRYELWSIHFCIRMILASWSAVIEYKGVIASKKANQIYVANHTTMVDWLVVGQNTPFCVVGQLHPTKPFVYYMQSVFLKALDCIWFNRQEQKDRAQAMQRIKDHIQEKERPRLLIFPEGTCVNNEYCIQFKKGAFGLGAEICPVAIKYNKSFADGYWISRDRSFPMHLFDIMTSWALVAEVYYLEPQRQQAHETDIEFTNRVKQMIAEAAGLKNVEWNGYLKHYKPSERVIDAQRKIKADELERTYRQMVRQTNIVDRALGNATNT